MKTIKVKFIKYHGAFAHDVNDVADLLASDAEKLIESGHAEAVDPEEDFDEADSDDDAEGSDPAADGKPDAEMTEEEKEKAKKELDGPKRQTATNKPKTDKAVTDNK